ncbi:hypothetical protein K2173_006609 [Erythroxylum novogranatense]|uniref:Plant bHLH transcription factor ACT-like domain-containing protein n=1 Tax=Erythroxylum novogranatense TaxID=1862640 RepID=A0AAV8T5E3_9ROSI|nr:hypothetical protein K2173_006609 [Erythroxylum novogranatense]
MVSRLQRRITLRRKLRILRTLTCSNSVQKRSIIRDALLYICKLKLKVEAIKRELSKLAAIEGEYLSLMKQPHLPKREVKVQSDGKVFVVRAICEKGEGKLVSILETFEEMGLTVLHARVSCNFYFSMEAIVVPEGQVIDGRTLTQAVLNAIGKPPERCS